MQHEDYLTLKPGMEVSLSYEPWGYTNVSAIIERVDVIYYHDMERNHGVFVPHIVCYVGKHRMIISGPNVWETLVISVG